MAVNMYDQAAEAPILNTYVPIDFDELYRIGVTQQEAVNQAQEDLGQALQTWSEFTSPSEIDMENWYNLTIGRSDIQGLLNQAAQDPNRMKDPAFRSQINLALNSVDYAQLGRLRQGRENMLARQEANRQLMISGRYNPLIHDVNFADYNTLQQGIFEDTTPLPYSSVVEMVKPYVDNLKDSFQGVKNGWIYNGVTEEQTDDQIRQHMSNIQSTPGYAQNLEIIKRLNPYMSDQEAITELNNQIFTAGREFARLNAERDPWAIRKAELEYRYSMQDRASRMKNLTTLIHEDAKRLFRANYNGLTGDAQYRFIEGGIAALNPEEKQIVYNNTTPEKIHEYNWEIARRGVEMTGNIYDGLRMVTEDNTFSISDVASEIYSSMNTNGKQLTNGNFKVSSLTRYVPEDELGANMAGMSVQSLRDSEMIPKDMRTAINCRNRLFMANDLDDVQIQAKSQAVSDNNRVFNKSYAYIPLETVTKYFNTDSPLSPEDLISLSGGSIVTLDNFSKVTTSTRYDNDGDVQSTTVTEPDQSKQYVRFDVVSEIPSSGERAITADAMWMKNVGVSTDTRDTQLGASQYERSSIYDWMPKTPQYQIQQNNNE